MNDLFRSFANKASEAMGSPWAFLLACLAIIVWAVSGMFFQFSEVWQLVINTSTTIITFLMIFLVQSTQNRDSKAMELKLDELLRVQKRAHKNLIDIEHDSEEDLEKEKKKEKSGKRRKQ